MEDRSELGGLPRAEYAFPGPQRDRLVECILSGEKTATASLLEEYRRAGEALPAVGDREVVVDSAGRVVCVTQVDAVDVLPALMVSDEFARAEGEGYADRAAWWRAHREFWTSEEFAEALGEPVFAVDEQALVVAVRFHVVRWT